MSDPENQAKSGKGPVGVKGLALAGEGGDTSVIYRHAFTVTGFTLLSRVLGMARDLVIAHRFGATGVTDAWVQAFRIPNALRRLTGEGSLTIAFVPLYVRLATEQGRPAAALFARRVLGLVLLFTLALAVLGMVFNEPLTALFSPGFRSDPEKFALAARLLAWTFPYLVLISVVAWAMGVLNSEGRFAAPAAAPALLNGAIIVAVVGFAGAFEVPVLSIAAGVLAGGLAQVLLQAPFLRSVGVPLLPRFEWNDPFVKRLFALLLPSLFGLAVYELNILVLGIIASYLPSGQIFHYNNATRLQELVMGLFTFAFTTAGLPTLSEHLAREDWPRVRETLRLTFSATLYIVFPAMVGLVVAGRGIVSMLYLHGAFSAADVESTASVLEVLALAMPAIAGVRVMVPVYYALGDARTPVIVSALTLVITGSLGWYLSQTYLVWGLAAGLTLGTWFQCGMLGGFLIPRARALAPWFPWPAALRQIAAALPMGLGVYWLHGMGQWQASSGSILNWMILIALVVGGAGAYLLLTLALGEPEAGNWVALARRAIVRIKPGAAGGSSSRS